MYINYLKAYITHMPLSFKQLQINLLRIIKAMESKIFKQQIGITNKIHIMVNDRLSKNISTIVINVYIIIAALLVLSLYGLYALTEEESFFRKHRSNHQVISYEEDLDIEGETIKAFMLFDY